MTAPRLRIMLVDDQKLILLGLERALRRMRTVWDVVVADSGRAAVELMAAEAADVLVTDLGMPAFSGVELLEWTLRHRPGTARIVLSGRHDTAVLQGATRAAHRFLTKPCDPQVLVDTILQAAELRDLPEDLREAVGGMGQLPASPVLAHRVKAYLNDPGAQLDNLQEAVRQDPGLAARALQLVNSSFFAEPRPLVDPGEALQFLDRQELACLAADPAPPDVESRLKLLRETHLQWAREAQAITRAEHAEAPVQKLAYAGALLSAAGPMILAMKGPTAVTAAEGTLSWHYLNLLGLPGPLLDLVGSLATPSRARAVSPEGSQLALAAVQVATGQCDESFLTQAGFQDRLTIWRQFILSSRGSV